MPANSCVQNNLKPPLSLKVQIDWMQRVLQNFLLSDQPFSNESPSATNTPKIDCRPFSVKTLMMLSCISNKAFFMGLNMQLEHMLKAGSNCDGGQADSGNQQGQSNPAYEAALQKLSAYIEQGLAQYNPEGATQHTTVRQH